MKCQNLTQGAIVVRTKKRSLGVGRNPIRFAAYVELQRLLTGRPFQFLTRLRTHTICLTEKIKSPENELSPGLTIRPRLLYEVSRWTNELDSYTYFQGGGL